MMVRVKGIGMVNVRDEDCPRRKCFWITDRLGRSGRTKSKRCGRNEQSGCPSDETERAIIPAKRD